MTSPPEQVRAHARSYANDRERRRELNHRILAGEYPSNENVLDGHIPLGGSLARDVRATMTDWLPHLRGQSHNSVVHKILPLVEAVERIPSAQTLKALWKLAGPLPASHAVFRAQVKQRLSWYLALQHDADAIAHIAVLTDSLSPFWRHAYLAGIVSANVYVDAKNAEEGFQESILAAGICCLEATGMLLDRYLPFASGKLSAEDILHVRTPEEQAEDEACEAEAVEICRTLRSPAVVEELYVPMHQVLQPVEGHRTSEKRDIGKMYEPLTRPLPLHKFGFQTLRHVRRDWPHAAGIIDAIASDLRFNTALKFRPFLIVGASGTGKTSIALAIAEALGLRSIVYPCASSADNSFGGTPSRWSTASASTPLELVRQAGVANPIVILDEIEKGGHHQSGNLEHALLPFLEPHTASRYHETALDMCADLSTVNYIATANSLEIPAPLRDRFRILKMPDPGPEHIGALVRRIVLDIAKETGQEGMVPPLQPDEEDLIRRTWKGGSLRKLRRAVQVLVENRDRLEVRQ